MSCGGKSKGLTLLEVLVALAIFAVAVLAALSLFSRHLARLRQQTIEKKIFEEASRCLEFVDRHLSLAQVNDLSGPLRMNFCGSSDTVRFIAPFSESEGSDLTKFGVTLSDRKVVVQIVRVDSQDPGLELPETFQGAQVLCGDVDRFRLQYSDGKRWFDAWDSSSGAAQEGMLPEMVRVDLEISPQETIDGRRQSRSFSRTVRLEAR